MLTAGQTHTEKLKLGILKYLNSHSEYEFCLALQTAEIECIKEFLESNTNHVITSLKFLVQLKEKIYRRY